MNNINCTAEKETMDKHNVLLMTTYAYPNYGGIITSYALYKLVQSLGFNPIMVNNSNKTNYNVFSENFTKRHLKQTKENLYSVYNHEPINNYGNTIIVGADCNWSPFFHGKSTYYLLPWANNMSKKISYATSFGTETFINNKYQFDTELALVYKYYLNKFDRISVRENSGVDLLKNLFEIEGTQVLDPVFLFDKNFYFNELIKKFDKYQDKNYIGCYLFALTKDQEKTINKIANGLNLNIEKCGLQVTSEIEEWLSLIYNSNLFITNSFHGLCFAIIFNRNFICISNKAIGNTRFLSVLKLLNLENRLLVDIEQIENRPDLFEPIDWEKVNSILEKEKEKSLKWLKEALEAPKDLSKIKPEDAMIQRLNREIIQLQEKSYGTVSKEEMKLVLNYKKNYLKYLKYKILKNFVKGKTKQRYKEKQKILHEKIRAARRLMD